MVQDPGAGGRNPVKGVAPAEPEKAAGAAARAEEKVPRARAEDKVPARVGAADWARAAGTGAQRTETRNRMKTNEGVIICRD